MKLHLPLCLRASLLACMASVTGFLTTVSTGTTIVGSVVLTAAISSSVHADWAPADISYTGTVTVNASATDALTLAENTTITYTYAGDAGPISANGFDVKLFANEVAATNETHIVLQDKAITARSVWFSQGRFLINAATVEHAGTLYIQGGQAYVSSGTTVANAILLGSTTYTENSDAVVAALRLDDSANINGTITLVEDAAISVETGDSNNPGSATISGAIATAGHRFEKKGGGLLQFDAAKTHSFDTLALNGGTLRSKAGGDNVAVNVGSLDVTSSSTLAHTSWNTVWTIGDVTSSAADSSGITLSLDNQGEHYYRQQYVFNGTAAIDDASLFDGIIDVKRTSTSNSGNRGNWQIEMHAGTATQLSHAVVNLNNYAILAITADSVELEGLTSTNTNAYVFSGANTDTTLTSNANNGTTPLYTVDGTMRTLTLSGNGDYSYAGTLAGNLTVEKTGSGLQTFGNLGDNITINLRSGSLSLKGTVGNNTTIYTEAGTTVTVPWKLTIEGNIYTASFETPDYVTGEGKIISNVIAAVGDTAFSTDDAKYTKLVVGDYAEDSVTITSGLVSIVTGNSGTPGTVADFGGIETFILDGGGFILPTSASQEFTFDKNIVVKSNGTLRSWGDGATTAILRLTGDISGNGTLTKTDGGTITLAGNMSGFTGGIVIGKGGLIFDTDATLSALEMNNGSTLGVTGGHHVTLTSSTDSPWVPKAGAYTIKIEDGSDFSTSRIRYGNASTLNLTSATHGSVTVQGMQMTDTANSVLTIGAHTALNVMGTATAKGQGGGTFNKNTTFLLIHHAGTSNVNVNGTLNMLYCGAFGNAAGSASMTIGDGGEMNVLGLDVVRRNDYANDTKKMVTMTFEAGSALHVGSGGIGNEMDAEKSTFNLIFNGGTIGILNSTTAWTTSKALTLSGDVVVDTRLYTAATDGTAGTYSDVGGTITMTGAVTGDGTLIKRGAGTLNLASVDKLDVQEGFVGTNGQLTINELTAMTAGGGRFFVDMGTDEIVASSYSGQLNLTANATSAGSYTIFTGSTALAKENIDFDIFLDRGLTFDAATDLIVNNGQVQVTIGGEATTEHFDLVWAGDAGEVWSNTTVQAWTGADDQRFSTGDSVTFDGGGIKDITIEGIVTPGAITVTGDENYAFSGGSIAGEGLLAKSGAGVLTINSDLSMWTGNVDLQGGTIAFAGSLGSGTIDMSGTSGLTWLKGNATDLSSRLKIAADAHVTFSVAEGDTVIFKTALSPKNSGETATFTKAGLGTLQLTNNKSLYGNVVVAEGTLAIKGGSDPNGSIAGSLTIQSGAKVLVERGNFTGWMPGTNITQLLLEEDAELVLGINSNKNTHSLPGGKALTMNGANITSAVTGNSFELTEQAVVTIGGSKLSTIEADLILDNGNGTHGTIFNVADAVAGEGVDLLIKGGISKHRGNTSLTKRGEGTMEITGNYAAGKIIVEAGGVILHDASLSGDAFSLAAGTLLGVSSGGTVTWNIGTQDRSVNEGEINLAAGATLRTTSDWKNQLTLTAGTVLSGNGTLVVGIPTNEGQMENDGRRITINGSTAGFSGVIELEASAGATNAYRGTLTLNSSDGIMNGVIRTQGVVFGAPPAHDEAVVPEMARITVQKDMVIGGFEGLGGHLETDVAAGSRIELTVGRDDDHAFGGSVGAQIDLVKTGSGKQTFNGDLSAFDGSISIEGGTLDMGSLNYAKSLAITGANASFVTTGKVSIGAGQTLTIGATGIVVNGDLDIGGGTLNLGDLSAESHAVGLGGHSLTLSSTDKTNLSLTLADDLAAGTVIDLFSNVSGLLAGETELTLGTDSLLSNYFNIEGIAALNNAKLQFVNGSLQIVLARGTNSLVYGLGDNGVWKTGTAFDSEGNLFTDEVNVEFGAIAEGNSMTVQLEGEINAGSITIDAGEGKTYHFVQQEGADPAGSLTAMNGMTITSGTADFAAGTLQPGADATITVNGGTLSLQDGATNDHVSITLGEGSTLRWGTDNTTDYAAGNKLTIRDNAHVTFDTNGNRVVLGQSPGSGVNGSKGHITLAGGGLIIGDGSVLHGTVDLGGQSLRLNGSGSAYDLNITGNGDLIVRGNVTLSGANDFTGTLHIGDKTDAEGLNGSPDNPLNATLTVTDASLGDVTAIELIVGANGTGSTMNYSASADAAIDADITGTGDVNFSGGHEITLSGANDYEGKTGIGADTTLKVTDTTLSSRTEIGNAGEAGGTLYLTNTKADGAFDFSHKVGDGVSVTVDGGTINWLTDAGHEKTYTGTTTIAANTTVTATGPLTTGENSKIVLNDATSTLRLDLTAAGMPTWTTGHTVSGAGTLELNGTGQTIAGSALVSLIDVSAGAPTLGNMKLTGGTLDIASEGQKTYLGKVQSLVIEAGAQLRVRSKGLQDQAGLTLSLAGAGTGEEGTASAAALYIGTGGSTTAVLGPITRNISLAADATVYVDANITGTLSGSFTGNGHTFTKTGTGTLAFTQASGLDTGSFAVNAGSLQFRADASATFGRVDLAAGATLSFYNGTNKDNKLTVSNLSLSGDATVQTTNFAGSILVDNLTGAGQTLTIDGASSATKMQFVIVQGGAFSGTIDVKQSNTGIERTLVFGATSADTLANAVVKLSQRASGSGNRLLAFAVGGEADGTIKIAGLEGIAESAVISTNTFNRDNITAETLADGNARTLEITGAGGTFSGSIGGKLTVDMNGSGTQTLAGMLADDSHYVATQGKLALSGTNQTGTHTFKANGGTLDMSGYTRAADATGKDTFAYSSGSIDNLHLASGMEITAGEGFTGSIQLSGDTVLDGGALHFELSGVDPEKQDLSTFYTIGTTGSLSLGDSGEKTYLYFNPEENTLDPSDEKTGKDYVLIANVGDAFDGVVNLEDILGHNMSTEGRAQYTFKIDTLDNGQKNLVLTVSGSAATLTWSGASGGIWNTNSDNLVWTDGTDTMSFMDDDKVHFGTMDSAQTIQIAEDGVRMGGMTVTGETDYTFNGGAITSSSARGGLKVGTLDDEASGTTGELFTGTLTINTANTYLGQTEINSGTVVAGNMAALSNTALSLNGGALHLNFEGTLGTSGVTMNGGELSALLDASVSNLTIAGADTAKILAAAAGKTLTLTTANGTIEGALTIGTADNTGTVRFDLGTRSLTTAQEITISGRLQLDGTTGSFTGTQVVLDGGNLHLTGGLTATLAGLSGSGKAIVDASTLAFSTTADTSVQIDASNAVIHGMEGTLSLGNLNLVSGTTALTGTVILNGITEGADTTLAIGKTGGNSGNMTLGAGVTTLANVMLAQGTLTVKDGDSLTFIESHGNVTTTPGESSLTIGAAWLKNGSSIDSKIAVTFTGSETLAGEKSVSWLGDSETGEKTTLGDVTVDIRHGAVEVGAQPSNVNLAGNVELSSLLIVRGSAGIYSNIATVTNGIILAGTEATLNMRNLNPQAGITLQQGSLSNAGNYTGTVTIDDVSTTGTSFAMGGLTDKATVVLAQFGKGSQLTGLGSLKLGNSTIQLSQGMNPAFKMNNTATGTVGIADGATVTFAIGSILGDVLKNGSGSYSVTDGSLSGLIDGDAFKNGVLFDEALTLHNIKAEVQGGNLVFTQLTPDNDTTYISSEEGQNINSYDAMDGFTKVVVDVDTVIDLTEAAPSPEQAADGLILKNLAGGSDLSVSGGEDDKITLNNNVSSTGFDGSISIDTAELQIRNTDALGDGSDPSQRELTIRGTLTSTGLVTITNGKLTLDGNGNSLDGGLTIIDQDGDKGQLTVNGSTALGGLIQGGNGNTADILVGQGATVSMKHGTTLQAWMSGSNAEKLAVADDAIVIFGDGAHVEGMSLNLGKNASATIETIAGDLMFNGLNGTGALVGETEAQLGLMLAEGTTAVFSGDLSAYEGQVTVTGAGKQVISTSAEQATIDIRGGHLTFRNDSADGNAVRSFGSTTLQGGSLSFDTRAVDNDGALVNRGIKLASLTTQAPVLRSATNSTLVFDMNLTNDLQDNALVTVANNGGHLAKGTVIEVNIHGIAANFTFTPGEDMSFTLLDGLDGTLTDAERDLSFNSLQSALNKYFSQTSLEFTNDNHTLVLTGTAITADEMRYHQNAASTETGRAGGALLDYLFVSSNPQGTAPGSLAANVLTAMEGILASGDKAQADRAMAAIAGSTITSLSASFAAGFDARLTSIRNRMTGMGVDQTLVNEDMPYFHAWISADGANTTLDADTTFAGYKLNSWGGTVGVDVDVNEYLTLGAAFTASYGDLTADGAEAADGNLDTYTAALFAHAQVKRWTHDIVLAVSTADASLDRTVDYGTGNYTAKGSTNGFGFGALYELAYNIPVGEDEDGIFSPLFRASFTHVSVDGYTETGAESMGLAVGKQDVSYATFGLGARYVAAVGENVFNRTATLELRAMVLQDAGSRRGEADVALNGSAGRTRTVKGAEPGSTGIQVGASLNVPVEESSAIFADVNFDARSKTTTVNGSVGYRINF